ncbi:MAG: hypothetical protein LAT68_05275 [Cyclobacteriaceae bacterium]|nr:hypothetical protein [Cyclobacteriaceae bacterium]MCH8515721.1 hypothetical protein [Cyclobacteriaceae bacterium]
MKLSYAFPFIVAGLLMSCSSSDKQENDRSEAFNKAKEEVNQNIQTVIAEVPSPSELPYLLQSAGVDFDADLVHDAARAGEYQSNNSKGSLVLGIYATDMAYLALHNNNKEALAMAENVKPLAEQLRLTAAFDAATLQRLESNLSSKDSIVSIANEIVDQADSHLRSVNRPKAAALVVGGGFIEGLYIGAYKLNSFPEDLLPEDSRLLLLSPLARILLNQKDGVKDLLKMLESVREDQETNAVVERLKDITKTYDKLDVKSKIEAGDGYQLLRDDNLMLLSEQIIALRNAIVE